MIRFFVLLFLLLSISGCVGVVDVVEYNDAGQITRKWRARTAFITTDGFGTSFNEPRTKDVIFYKF